MCEVAACWSKRYIPGGPCRWAKLKVIKVGVAVGVVVGAVVVVIVGSMEVVVGTIAGVIVGAAGVVVPVGASSIGGWGP